MAEFGPAFYLLAAAVLVFVFFLFLFVRRIVTGFREGVERGKN
jgi:hypothetical protein